MAMGFRVFDTVFKNVNTAGKTVLATIAGVLAVSTAGVATGLYNIAPWIPTITAILFGMFLIVEGSLRLAVPKGMGQLIALASGLIGLAAIIVAVLGMFAIATPAIIATIASVASIAVIVQFFV